MSGTAYSTAPYDTAVCRWCTNDFTRSKQQADRGQRFCGHRCAQFARAITLPDSHFVRMARLARQSYSRNKAARLAARLAGKTLEQCYRLGYKDGHASKRKDAA